MNYWQRRNVRAQEAVSNKSIKEIEKQLSKYYNRTAKRVMREFEATYNKLLATTAAGRAPTPADLYKLDKYWQMQGQLQRELQKLGDQSVKVMQEAFVKQFTGVYDSLALPGGAHYTTVSREAALQMINSIWCADGKAWSARVWTNTDLLQETLNEQLVHCVVTGKKPTELKNLLQERFNVSYSQADTLVRTETAHIQTQAAQKRYEDYGIKEVEVWVDEDERTCPICAKHEGERYKVNDRMPVPFHPRCRCCMIPVVEIEAATEEQKPAETPAVERRTRRPREGYRRESTPDFETMGKKDIESWSKANLKTRVDYKGATDEAARIVAKNLHELEKQGVDLQDIQIKFSGTRGDYGGYVPSERTIHLRPNTNFVDRMLKEDERALYKLKKPQHAVSSYKGVLNHEIGHALDHLSGYEISKAISSDRLYRKAVNVSNYAGSQAAYGAPRASEAVAENISKMFDGSGGLYNVDEEIRSIVEEQLKKLKKKKRL